MQSRTNASGHGLVGMAFKAGKGTDSFAAIPNRRNRARGPTQGQRPQPMTQRKRLTASADLQGDIDRVYSGILPCEQD